MSNTLFGKLSVVIAVLFVLSTRLAVAQTDDTYLSCRILAQSSPQAVSFASAAVLWSDEELHGLRNVPNGDLVYECSRELRFRVCRTLGGPIMNHEKLKEDAVTGGFLMGMGGGGTLSGMALFGAGSMIGTMLNSQMEAAQCYSEIEELTASFGDKVSLDWQASVPDAHGLSYEYFLQIVYESRRQETLTTPQANRVVNFTDGLVYAVSG